MNTVKSGLSASAVLSRYGFPIVLASVFVFFSVATRSFLTLANLDDMAHDMSPLIVISAAEAFVVMSGKVDLSQHDESGGRKQFLTCGPGGVIGEMAQLVGRPMLLDAHAQGRWWPWSSPPIGCGRC